MTNVTAGGRHLLLTDPMPEPFPSLDLVLEEARTERRAQLQRFEALDTKAGVVLGFAGALVALAPSRVDPLLVVGRSFGVASGLSALGSFWPRWYWLTDLTSLRDRYLKAEPAFTKMKLVDAMVVEAIQARVLLIRRAMLLKLAMVTLALAVTFVAAASA